MSRSKRTLIEGAISAVPAVVLMAMMVMDARGQEVPAEPVPSPEPEPAPAPVEHPAFGPTHTSLLTVQSVVPDIPKLEQRVVDILRAQDPALTSAQARAKLRIDGKTDVALCLELLIIYQVGLPVQFEAVTITVANEHPVPQSGVAP